MTQDQQAVLIKEAIQGMKHAFTGTNKPDDVRFGASVLTKKGNVYGAGAYFSDTYSLTLHGEQAALAHAAAHGEYDIEVIAIIGNTPAKPEEPIYPCHLCKQLLWESHLRSGINTTILLLDETGEILETLKLLDIMNYPWPAKTS